MGPNTMKYYFTEEIKSVCQNTYCVLNVVERLLSTHCV